MLAAQEGLAQAHLGRPAPLTRQTSLQGWSAGACGAGGRGCAAFLPGLGPGPSAASLTRTACLASGQGGQDALRSRAQTRSLPELTHLVFSLSPPHSLFSPPRLSFW